MSSDNSSVLTEEDAIDWKLCVICQESTKESLQCPSNLKPSHTGFGKGYVSFSEIVDKFTTSGICFPAPIKLNSLKGKTSMVETLSKNNAKWHKTCRNKFTELKLDREVHRLKHYKNPGLVCSEVTPAKITRKSTEYASVIDKNSCFMCNKSESQLPKFPLLQ
jgi:hypothetical protein